MKTGLFYRICLLIVLTLPVAGREPFTLDWEDNILTIQGDHIPGEKITIWYLEAYCRDNSRNSHWGNHTVVGHKTERVYHSPDKTELKLRCEVDDGLVVEHLIRATEDEVDIQIKAYNPTSQRSQTHWAQPCVRVGSLKPQENLTVRGKLYLMDNDIPALLQRYYRDFPSHRALHSQP